MKYGYIIALLFVCFHAFAKAEKAPLNAENTVMPCAILNSPVNGQTNVLVESIINWDPEPDVFGYAISLGTTPGGIDIANNVSVGVTPAFMPPLGLPENTLIFVTIEVLIDQTTSVVCDSQSFTTTNVTTIPDCTQVSVPTDGATNVDIGVILQWMYAPRATGYILDIGTTPGATDVIANEDVGNTLSFNIPFDLDPNTTYFVTVTPYNENGQNDSCLETSFTTENINTEAPPCTTIITPADGVTNVALTPLVTWNPVPEATGYRLTVGTSPGGSDVLDFADIGNTTSTLVIDFDEDTLYYIRIFPYNEAGVALDCQQTTFSTTLGCGPYDDPVTGEIIDFSPTIELEERYDICEEDHPLTLVHIGDGDSFEWVRVINNAEITIGTAQAISITEEGLYRFYVSEDIAIEAGFVICESFWEFEVFVSEAPVIENLSFQNAGIGASVQVEVSGNGDYEFSIGNIDGPYQDSPEFTNVSFSDIQVFVRDKNGCGVAASDVIDPDRGFPKYFTPNGDGVNDYWQVRGVVVNGQRIEKIDIYDRFGKRITTISPFSIGWDGTYNGKQLLDAGFWYKATSTTNQLLIGPFALRRN